MSGSEEASTNTNMMLVPLLNSPAQGCPPNIRVSVRCLSADLSQQERIVFAINSSAHFADLLGKAQCRVKVVPPGDLVELFFADCRLELTDVVGEVLTTESLTLVAAASDAYMFPPKISLPAFSVLDAWQDKNTELEREAERQDQLEDLNNSFNNNFELEDALMGLKLVTAPHPSKSPSTMVLSPDESVQVRQVKISSCGEKIILVENLDGDEAWFPASVITAQRVLRAFQSSEEECSDHTKRQLNCAVGDLLYHCSKGNGWMFCTSIRTGEKGWVPAWAFTLPKSPTLAPEHAAPTRRRTEPAATPTKHPSSSSPSSKARFSQKTKDLPVSEKRSAASDRIPRELSRGRDLKSRRSKGGKTEIAAKSPSVKKRKRRRQRDDSVGVSVNGCVRKVCGRAAMYVDQIALHMRNGTVQTFGSDGGEESCAVRLVADELITSVTQVEQGQYLGASMTFETSRGQTIEIKGWTGTGRKWQTHTFTASSGQQICNIGFEGSRLSFVETLPADGKGEPCRIMIGEDNVSQDQSDQSAPSRKSSRRRSPVEIPPPPTL